MLYTFFLNILVVQFIRARFVDDSFTNKFMETYLSDSDRYITIHFCSNFRKDSSTIDIEDVTLKDDTAITLQYDDIQLDSRSIPLAAIPPVQSTYKTNETHILTQSKSVPFAAEPLLRHTSTSTKSTMNTPSISLSPRLTHSRAGVPSRYQNYRFKV